jgi:predicted amidohydrolase YtcJ
VWIAGVYPMKIQLQYRIIRMTAHIAALAGILMLPSRSAAQQPADLILYNGKVLTVDSNFSVATAVAITGNKLSAVGTDDEVLTLGGPQTQKFDLKGRTVTPGMIDTHRHIFSIAEDDYGALFSLRQLHRYPVEWRGVKTKDDVLAQLTGIFAREKFEPGRWIYLTSQVSFRNDRGSSLEDAEILYLRLNQWELDKVSPDNPLLMSLGIPDFNGLLLNKQAMDWVMTHHGDFVKRNGRYWVDSQGRPDGHLEPPASRLVLPFTYDRAPQVLGEIYSRTMAESSAMGLTTVSTRMPKDALAAYQLLEKNGRLRFRIGYGVNEAFGNTDLQNQDLKRFAKQINAGTEKIWITGVGPSAVDGDRSRQCTQNKRSGTYTSIDGWFPFGQCHTDPEYKGAAMLAGPIHANYFQDWIMASGRDGVRFANTHVAGDRATAQMLNFIEQLHEQYGPDSTKNWAFDHCGMINPKDFARLARLNIMVSCYVMVSVNDAAAMARAYGEEVAHTYPSPVGSLLKAGVKVVLESDSDSYIWEDLQAAITRKDRRGRVWGEQDRVDRPTALRMITNWAADYVLRGDQIGSLEAGKFADLLVLDQDYLTVPGDEISKIQPQLTIFDGKIVFVHPDFSSEYELKPHGAIISTYKDLVKGRVGEATLGTGG